MRALLAILALLLSIALLVSCGPGPEERPAERVFKQSEIAMDTVLTITVVAPTEEEAKTAIDAAMAEVRRLEGLLNFWADDSEIAAIYRNAGTGPVKVSPDTLAMIKAAMYVSEQTAGAFDPTVGPLMRLWDFRKMKMPAPEEVSKRLGLVDYKAMKVDPAASTAFLAVRGMSFDTGGIAKGYAVDRAVERLKAAGIKSGMVALAGDIRAFGARPGGGKPWRVGIRDPRAREGQDDVIATVTLTDQAISTSGDYERFFVRDGVRYHHILDPATGMPARGTRSISVITKQSAMADGFSTGAFVMGPRAGMALLQGLGMDAFIITEEGEMLISPALKERIKLRDRQ